MEPDTQPLRSYWLDAIVDQITEEHYKRFVWASNWWAIGSLYRGSMPMGQNFLHINGNALYHLSSSFIDYVQLVTRAYPYESHRSNGYDLDLFVFLSENTELAKRLWHKFRFSDFIQNCWSMSCGNDIMQFTLADPHTFLIHRSASKHKIMNENAKKPQYILLRIIIICVIPIIIIVICVWRCRCFPVDYIANAIFSYEIHGSVSQK